MGVRYGKEGVRLVLHLAGRRCATDPSIDNTYRTTSV